MFIKKNKRKINLQKKFLSLDILKKVIFVKHSNELLISKFLDFSEECVYQDQSRISVSKYGLILAYFYVLIGTPVRTSLVTPMTKL